MMPGAAELATAQPRRGPAVGAAWYVVHAHPNQENRAEQGIREGLGFATFLPVEKRFVRHARRRESRSYSLFGPYFFVSFDVHRDDQWPEIRHVVGVDAILSNGLIPQPVRAEDIDAIRTAQKLGYFDQTLGTNLAGRSVRILNQSALDLVGKIRSVGADRRAEVVLSLLGRDNVVKVDLARLRPA